MPCISHQHEYQVAIVLVPPQIFISELFPDGLGLGLPSFGMLPVESVEIVKNSWGVNNKVVLTVVDHNSQVSVQDILKFSFVGGGEVSIEVIVHLLVVVNVVNRIRYSKIFLFVLHVVFVVGIDVTCIILVKIEYVHA